MESSLSTSVSPCPIGSLSNAISVAKKWLDVRGNDYDESMWDSIRSENRDQIPWHCFAHDDIEDYPESIEWNGRKWNRIQDILIDWSCGPEDQTHVTGSSGGDKANPKHFHCDIKTKQTTVHLDCIAWSSWGPYSGIHENMFSVDRTILARGGRMHYPFAGGGVRNLPCALVIENQLIVTSRTFNQLPTSDNCGVSVWGLIS